MIRFNGFAQNERFSAGCTGRRVFLYDRDGKQIACFDKMNSAIFPLFSPDDSTLAVKSTSGLFSVISLETLSVVKQFEIPGSAPQFCGFCFSRDGRELYAVQNGIEASETKLLVYDTADYTVKRTLLAEDKTHNISFIEYDELYDGYFVLGTMPDSDGTMTCGFVAELLLDDLRQIKAINAYEYEIHSALCCARLTGFRKWDETLLGDEIDVEECKQYTLAKLLLENK